MAYDEGLAERVRTFLEERTDVVEKKMFGGLSFMLRGNMFCGVLQEELLVRVGPDGHQEALAKPHARPMEFTGRGRMKGMVFVGPDGVESDEDLSDWIGRGVDFALSLPAK